MRFATAATLAALTICACGDSFSPTQSNVAGTYSATRLETVTGGVTTDQLAAGATLTLALAANGSVTGRLFVPNGDEGGGKLDESMAGTWVLSGGSVTFSQTADTFVRNTTFTATSDKLTGEMTFGGTTVTLTLAK